MLDALTSGKRVSISGITPSATFKLGKFPSISKLASQRISTGAEKDALLETIVRGQVFDLRPVGIPATQPKEIPDEADLVGFLYEALETIPAPFSDRWAVILMDSSGTTDLLVHCHPALGGWGCEPYALLQFSYPSEFGVPEELSVVTNLHEMVLLRPNIWDHDGASLMGLKAAYIALRTIQTNGAIEHVSVPPKLAKARARRGKPPLAGHYRLTDAYRTALQFERSGKRPAQGGTHASPIPHLRRGHMRRLADGKLVNVRDCMVGGNFQPGQPVRSGYILPRGKQPD
ncbi:hypothetical protein [Roseibium aggregatum]|uniref:hypothetical protein n=1 Tax=Roseibium aggregatum TaxID=187304 RepID=UPI001A8D2030|nr:hypothetical protein [Roseibium aggregatum]MBN8182021.1 hypothetical protein [Roseibium aggregatum]